MNMLMSAFGGILNDNANLLLAVLVFLAAGTLAFSVMAFARVRRSVKQRASHIADDGENARNSRRSLRYSSLKAVTRLLEYTTKHYSGTDDENMRVLRQRLIQAGIFDPRGVAYFFMARTALAIGLAGGLLSGGHGCAALVELSKARSNHRPQQPQTRGRHSPGRHGPQVAETAARAQRQRAERTSTKK